MVLNSDDAKAVVDALYGSYNKLLEASMENFGWNSGQHMKVHVQQVNAGQDGFEEKFAKMLSEQYAPFLKNNFGILPEFDGFEFTPFSNSGSSSGKSSDTRDIRALVDDIFSFTARGFGIPPVLVLGDVAGIDAVVTHWLTTCIDPLAAQISEELNRKLYGRRYWQNGDRVSVDTSTIQHFDILNNADKVEKIVESATWSINELREKVGDSAIMEDWANIHWMTKNIATVEAIARNAAAENNQKEDKNSA